MLKNKGLVVMKKIALETFIKEPKNELHDVSVTYNEVELFLFLKDKAKMIELMDKREKPKENKCTGK